MTRKFLILSILLLPILSFAHGGEDHGESTKQVGVTYAAPRAEAHTNLFELVAIPQNGLLTIYVDHFANNQPVTDPKVKRQLESSSQCCGPWYLPGCCAPVRHARKLPSGLHGNRR